MKTASDSGGGIIVAAGMAVDAIVLAAIVFLLVARARGKKDDEPS